MKRFDAPLVILAGTVLILVANAVVLGATWWNRSGSIESRIELTERELAMPLTRASDDTGLVLTIALADEPPATVRRVASRRGEQLPSIGHPWLDARKLSALGFDVERISVLARERRASGRIFGVAARSAYVALEYDGEAWRTWLAARDPWEPGFTAADAAALLAIDRTSRSRLMPVDAASDPASLRAKYPDASRVAIVPAYVGARANRGEDGTITLSGAIERLEVGIVSVPRALLTILDPLAPRDGSDADHGASGDVDTKRWPEPIPPRYRVTLAYGRGFRPWLEDAAPTAQ